MKRTLLFSAFILAATVGFAQSTVRSVLNRQNVPLKHVVASQVVAAQQQSVEKLPVLDVQKQLKATAKRKSPRKLMSDGLFYSKPEGTLYGGWDYMDGGRGYYFTTLISPAFTELTFTNKSEGRTSWTINGEDASENVVDQNYVSDYRRSEDSEGNALYYAPTVESLSGTYTLGEYNYLLKRGSTEVKGIIRIDSMTCMTPQDTRAATYDAESGTYYGPYALWGALEGDNIFGTGSLEGWGNCTYAVQVFDKPATPLYFNRIYLEAVTNTLPIAEGAQLKAHITGVKTVTKNYSDGTSEDFVTADMDNIFATFYASSTDTLDFVSTTTRNKKTLKVGYVYFDKPGYEDLLGNIVPGSVVVDQQFAVVIDGFNEEGIDLGLYGVEIEDGDDGVQRCQQWFDNDNFITYVSNISMAVSLYGMFDRAVAPAQPHFYTFEDENLDYRVVRVPVEGSEPYAEVYGFGNYTDGSTGSPFVKGAPEDATGYCGVPVFTSTQWFDEDENTNYDVIDLPDWITSVSIDPTFGYGMNQVMFFAEPLPEGMTGRKAQVRVVGQMEVGEEESEESTPRYSTVSDVITIIQGVDPDDNPQPEVLDFTINHERQTGLGYTADQVAVDLTEAAAYLGVDAVTTDMLRIENPDGTLISDYAPFDGWFDGDGVATAWGDNTKICVKFFQALEGGQFDVCDMNGADEDGKTYTVKWQLVNGEKAVRYTINVTFKKPEVKELEIVDKGIATSVTYDVTEGDYVMKTATITDEQVAAICQELGIEALTDATIFGFNPTTKELVKNYTGYDGWRDANGDFHNWNTDGTQAPACVKINDNGTTDGGQTYYCYNRSGQEPQTIKCYWALANEEKAVLVEIDFVYFAVNPDAPELMAPEGWTSVISNGNLAGDDVKSFIAKEYPSTEPTGATIVPGAGKDGSRGIVVKSQDKVSQAWDSQFWIQFSEKLPDGTKLHVEFDYKADLAGSVGTQSHGLPGNYQHWAAIGNVDFDTEWKHFTTDVDVTGDMVTGGGGDGMLSIAFNLNDIANANNYYFDNFGVWIQKPAPVDDWTNILRNSDLEGSQVDNFFSKEAPSTAVVPSTIFDGAGVDGSRGIKVVSAPAAENDWDTQFWIYLPTTLPEGTKYKVEFDYKADRDASADTQAHGEPGNYIHFSMIGSPSFTTEWQHYVKEGSISADQAEAKTDGVPNGNKMRSIAFNLSKDKDNEVTYFFDNIKFFVEKAFAETGIVNVNSNNTVEGAIYNLRGQQVKNAQKGIFIQNGKKIVVK